MLCPRKFDYAVLLARATQHAEPSAEYGVEVRLRDAVELQDLVALETSTPADLHRG